MGKKILISLLFVVVLLSSPVSTYAQLFITPIPNNPAAESSQLFQVNKLYELPLEPIPCQIDTRKNADGSPQQYTEGTPKYNCPQEIEPHYREFNPPEFCAATYEDFLSDPVRKHYWVEDPKITNQGKTDERARQFLYWVLTTNAIDEAPVLRSIWSVTSLIAFFGVVLVAAVFGIGYIISRRTNYNFSIRIWPTIMKIGAMLLYVAFSAAIVFLLIQLSEILMKFFIENMGGNKLFNIYFATPGNDAGLLGQTEKNYKEFVGCRDLNIRVQEGVNTEMYLLKMTNITYYVMGIMLLLRKILLWFLLFVSPFLALLMPFVFVRNIGWIWIGVFFQWLFYGPLLALFLGATSKIWDQGIPFGFDFSRANTTDGYVYPTGIIIAYGGPAQRIIGSLLNRPLGALNNGNYIDTFAEYIITLIMLWAVTFFPWWLLRIFRDYCCEGIYAMKNILLAIHDQMRVNPPNGPSPTAPGPASTLKLQQDTPVKTDITVSLGSMEKMKKMMSQDITKNLNLQATRITDVARLETNKVTREATKDTIAYLANPVQARIPAKRTEFMNLRTELFNRAIKNDTIARSILSSTSTSTTEKTQIRERILNSLPKVNSIQDVMGNETKTSKETVNNITNNYTSTIVNNKAIVQHIANTTNSSAEQVKNILNSYSQNTSLPPAKITSEIAKQQNVPEITVKKVLDTAGSIGKYEGVIQQNSVNQKIPKEQVTRIIASIHSFTSAPSVMERITNKVSVPTETVKQFITNTYNTVISNESAMQTIAQESNTSTANVSHVLNSYAKNIDQSSQTILENISKETNVDTATVQNIMQNTSHVIEQSNLTQVPAEQSNISTADAHTIVNTFAAPVKIETSEPAEPIVKIISYKSNATEGASKNIVQNILTQASADKTLITNISNQTGLQEVQVQNVLKTYSQNVDKPAQTIINQINTTSGIPKDKVQAVLKTTSDTVLASQGVVAEVAKQSGVTEEQVAQTMQTQMQVATKPEDHIEKTISIPQSVSIEDYEQVKEMWIKHYEAGEIPVSDTIKNRTDWVEQETIYITNTLNKILSSDEKLRQDGLDELGYLLPIFLINNLKGEELIVYLKAKLEAAKSVQKMLEKEESLKEKLENDNEDDKVLVNIPEKQEEEKTMEMTPEDEQNKTPQSIEDRTQAVQEKLEQIQNNATDAPPFPSLEDIKSKLQQQSEKPEEN